MLTRQINGRHKHFKLEKMTRHTPQGDILAFSPEAFFSAKDKEKNNNCGSLGIKIRHEPDIQGIDLN